MPEQKQDRKIKIEMAMAEAADWLRDLADRLESPDKDPGDAGLPDLGDFTKIKIGFNRVGDRVRVKAKVKGGKTTPAASGLTPEAVEAAGEAEGQKDAYKELKKSMKKSYKAIKENLDADALPPADAVAAFLSDSERMIRFPGYGDEYYESYRAACFRFKEAHRNADLPACKSACDEMERLKSDCHDRYK